MSDAYSGGHEKLAPAWESGVHGGHVPRHALLKILEQAAEHTFATGSDHYIQVHQPDLVLATTALLIDRSAQQPR